MIRQLPTIINFWSEPELLVVRCNNYHFASAFDQMVQSVGLLRLRLHSISLLYGKASVLRREGTGTAGWQAYCACYRRELTLTGRYNFLYIFRVCQVAAMATITGTMFMRTRQAPTSLLNGQNFISVSFFSVMFLFFNGQTELTIAVGHPHMPCSLPDHSPVPTPRLTLAKP